MSHRKHIRQSTEPTKLVFGTHNGHGYKVTYIDIFERPKPFVEIWCWKCLSYTTPILHPWSTCDNRRITLIRDNQPVPAITPEQVSHHSTEIATLYCAVVQKREGKNPIHTPYSPYPIQDAKVTSSRRKRIQPAESEQIAVEDQLPAAHAEPA